MSSSSKRKINLFGNKFPLIAIIIGVSLLALVVFFVRKNKISKETKNIEQLRNQQPPAFFIPPTQQTTDPQIQTYLQTIMKKVSEIEGTSNSRMAEIGKILQAMQSKNKALEDKIVQLSATKEIDSILKEDLNQDNPETLNSYLEDMKNMGKKKL